MILTKSGQCLFKSQVNTDDLESMKKYLIRFLKKKYDLQKSRALPVGTIRIRKDGRKYKKVSKDKWSLFYEGQSRGQLQAVKNVIKKIEKAESRDELAKIIKENRKRFVDEKGNVDKVVKEFLIKTEYKKFEVFLKEENRRIKNIEKKEKVKVMSLDDYLGSKGLSAQDYGDPGLHVSGNVTSKKVWDRLVKYVYEKDQEKYKEIKKVTQEYNEKVKKGEIRDLNYFEKLERKASGHKDNESVQAARRLLRKKGKGHIVDLIEKKEDKE